MADAPYARMLDAISEGVVVFGKDRKITYCNQSFMNMTGYDRSDMAGVLCSIMQGPDTDPATITAIDDALQAGKVFSGEILNYRKSGEPFWNHLTFTPEFAEDGTVLHYIGVSRDITKRKNAESQVTRLERDYRFIFENVLSGVVLHGANTEIRFVNPRAAELLGLSNDALLGVATDHPQWDLIHPDGSPVAVSEYPVNRAIADKAPVKGIVQGYRRPSDNKLICLVCNAFPVLDDDEEVTDVLVSFTDITRLIDSENEAKAFRERFELAARAPQDVIFEWNVETGEYWANDSFKTVYGFDPPSHISLDALGGISAVETDHDLVRSVTLDAIQSGKERYTVDYGFIRPDGSIGHAAVRAFVQRGPDGKALRIIGTGTDVGRLTEAMTALEQSEMRFRLIADTASDVLWDYDIEQDKVWVSPDWPAKLGIEVPDFAADAYNWMEFVDPADKARVLESCQSALKSQASQWEIDYKMASVQGETIDVAARATILRHPDGKAYRMLGNIRNITKERRYQEGYTRARALEAVGQLTGGVAHDFNNLLMIIQGNAELLEMGNLSKDDEEAVAMINKAAESASTLIRRLLTFSGQEKIYTTCVDLRRAIPDTIGLLRAGLPESIDLRCEISPDVWEPEVDANGLEQALVNLAMNAMDAMPGGGSILVTCQNQEVNAKTAPRDADLEPGRYVAIAVTDTGEGMSDAVLLRAFEPFFTTKDVGKGTGLGLSTVYGFAKQSGGGVTIASKPGRGTTVTLYLRKHEGGGDSIERGGGLSVPEDADARRRILVVEDQPEVLSYVQKTLARFGYKVEAVAESASALAKLQAGEKFDLLFTDIIMPGGMNGQELAEAAVKRDPLLKVLYTSGYSADAFEHLGIDEQAQFHLLRKPYKAAELKDVVLKVLQD